jgi:hypothetical protein
LGQLMSAPFSSKNVTIGMSAFSTALNRAVHPN